MNNKNTMKKLLATASTLAVLASGSSAFAVDYVVTGGPGDANAHANIRNAAGALGVAVPPAENTFYLNDQSLTLNAPHGNFLQTVNLWGNTGKTITLSVADVQLAIANPSAAAALDIPAAAQAAADTANGAPLGYGVAVNNAKVKIALDANAAHNAIIKGGSEFISEIDFAHANKTITLSHEGAVFTTTTFKSTNGASGKLVIAANTTINNGAFSNGAAAVNDLEVDADKTLTLTGNTDLTNVANASVVKGTLVASSGTNAGKVNLTEANSLLQLDGTSNSGAVTVTNAAKVVRNGLGTTAEVNLNHAGAALDLKGGTVTTVKSNAPGVNGAVNVLGTSTAKLESAGGNYVKDLNFKDSFTLTLSGDSQVKNINVDEGKKGVIHTSHDLIAEKVGAEGRDLTIKFTADKTLTVSGKEFHAGVITANAGDGKVVFGESLTVHGTLGSDADSLGEVTVAVGKAVDFGSSLVRVGKLNLAGADSKATITSVGTNGKALQILAGAANQGEVTFNNDNDLEVEKIGAGGGAAVKKVILAGSKNVTVKTAANSFNTNTVHFEEAAAGTVFTSDVLAGAYTTASKTSGGTVAFTNAATALAADFGKADNSLTALNYTGKVAAALDLANKNTFGAIVTANTKDLLTVNNAGAAAGDTTYGGFGTADAQLVALNFVAGAGTSTVAGATYAKTVTLSNAGASNHVFNGNVVGETFNVQRNDNKVTFGKNVVVDSKIVAAAAGNGQLTFKGGNTIKQAIGTAALQVGALTFEAGNYTIEADMLSNAAVSLAAGTYTVGKDIKVAGTLTAADKTIIDLGTNTLTIDGNLTVNGTTVKINRADSAYGSLDLGARNLTNADKLTVNVVGSYAKSGTKLTDVIGYTNAKNDLAKIVIDQDSRLTKWTFVEGSDANHLTLSASTDTATFFNDVKALTAKTKDLVTALAAEETSVKVQEILAIIGNEKTSDAVVVDTLSRLTAAPQTTAVSAAVADSAMDVISTRAASGIGAGDEDSRLNMGVWGQGFASRATQKARKGDAGYKASTGGGTVGVDAMVSDNTTLGLAASYSTSSVKFKDQKSGDKAKSTNMFFSVYGTHNLGNSWFVQGAAGFGSGNVKADSKRVVNTAGGYDVATAKYDTMAFSLEGKVGYDFRMTDSASLVPALGVRYTNVNEGGYSEKGSAFNRTVTKKAADRLTGIAGLGVQANMDMGGTVITPEAHAYVNYDFKSKNPKVEARLDGMTKAMDVTSGKAEKMSYNLGAGLSARTGMVEFGAGYDAKLANKFVSHQGTLRLRVDL